MADNENVVNTTKKVGFGAKVKEFFRKQTVALKQKPQKIPLVYLTIVTVYFMLALYKISDAVQRASANEYTGQTGICLFIVTLLSLLILVSFLNAFPKRKKPNIFFIVLVCVMAAAMIACDVVYYVEMNNCLNHIIPGGEMHAGVSAAQPFVIAHVVLLGVFLVLFALLPVYSKLIKKIDTSVKLESATENMGKIDIED